MNTKIQQLMEQKKLQNPANIHAVVGALVDTLLRQKIQEIEEDVLADAKKYLSEIMRTQSSKLKGDKGDKGDQGDVGFGVDGKDGKDGRNGKDGKNGVDGKNGKDGLDGANGKDGSPDTPDQVIEKINISTKTIPLTKIDGLTQELSTIRTAIKQKSGSTQSGGGIGNIQHETNNVSSATTTIVTSHKIAQKGYAIIGAYYQGQFIFRGTHYTVGTDMKTLTLTFTPENSTIIDIIYIRG